LTDEGLARSWPPVPVLPALSQHRGTGGHQSGQDGRGRSQHARRRGV